MSRPLRIRWRIVGWLWLLSLSLPGWAADFAARCADRAAIERVYYQHRLGAKPPFEETLPPAALAALVRLVENKENALQKVYGVTITPALLAAEIQRINSTTKAPDMLAEIKAALGGDPDRFANAFAKPFLVERLLRDKFDNDDALHAAQRRQCESIRNELLAAKTNGVTATNLVLRLKQAGSNAVSEITWQLAPPPAADANTAGAEELEIKKRFGANAQLLSTPAGRRDTKFYFDELPGDLQNVLRAQLRHAADVSAVIETPRGFLLYVAEEKTSEKLTVAALSIPKQSYEAWLEKQSEH